MSDEQDRVDRERALREALRSDEPVAPAPGWGGIAARGRRRIRRRRLAVGGTAAALLVVAVVAALPRDDRADPGPAVGVTDATTSTTTLAQIPGLDGRTCEQVEDPSRATSTVVAPTDTVSLDQLNEQSRRRFIDGDRLEQENVEFRRRESIDGGDLRIEVPSGTRVVDGDGPDLRVLYRVPEWTTLFGDPQVVGRNVYVVQQHVNERPVLVRAPLDGGSPTIVFESFGALSFAVSPDERRVATVQPWSMLSPDEPAVRIDRFDGGPPTLIDVAPGVEPTDRIAWDGTGTTLIVTVLAEPVVLDCRTLTTVPWPGPGDDLTHLVPIDLGHRLLSLPADATSTDDGVVLEVGGRALRTITRNGRAVAVVEPTYDITGAPPSHAVLVDLVTGRPTGESARPANDDEHATDFTVHGRGWVISAS